MLVWIKFQQKTWKKQELSSISILYSKMSTEGLFEHNQSFPEVFFFLNTSLVLLFECVSSHKILKNTKQILWQILLDLKMTHLPTLHNDKLCFPYIYAVFYLKNQNSHFYFNINACRTTVSEKSFNITFFLENSKQSVLFTH